ncbi:MAG: hypothetical protein IKD31_05965 [Clostridia bacterium]|nr:hypothetical protein [Clostridia bacterium]
MKRILLSALSLMLFSLLFLSACTCQLPSVKTTFYSEETEEEEKWTFGAFEEALLSQPVVAVDTDLLEQRLEADLLLAAVQNNSAKTLTKIYIAFAAWNEAREPIKLRDAKGVAPAEYVQVVYVDRLEIKPGELWEGRSGYAVSDACEGIYYVKAIAAAFESEDGYEENPLFETWRDFFEGKRLDGDRIRETDLVHSEPETEPAPDRESALALEKAEKAEPIYTASCEYREQDRQADLLMATVQNNSGKTVTKIYVAFAAWDKAGEAVKIRSEAAGENTGYIKICSFSGVSVPAGALWQEPLGLSLAEESESIAFLKAFAAAFECEDGSYVENPLFAEWKRHYEGKPLADWAKKETLVYSRFGSASDAPNL